MYKTPELGIFRVLVIEFKRQSGNCEQLEFNSLKTVLFLFESAQFSIPIIHHGCIHGRAVEYSENISQRKR